MEKLFSLPRRHDNPDRDMTKKVENIFMGECK